MNVSCGNCPAKYAVPDDKVRGRKVRIQCKRCGSPIIVDGTRAAASAAAGQRPDAAAIAASRAAAKRTMIGLPPPAVLPEAPVAPVAPVAPIEPLPPPPQALHSARARNPRTATMVGVAPPAFLDAKNNRDRPARREVAVPAPAPPEWTVALSETDRREMNTAEIAALYIAGTVTPDTFIWKEGMSDWQTPWDIAAIANALRLKGLRQPDLSQPPRGSSVSPSQRTDPQRRSFADAMDDATIVGRASDRLLELASEGGDDNFGEEEEVTVIAKAGQHLSHDALFGRRVNEPTITTKPAASKGVSYDDVTVTLATERSQALLAAAETAGDDEVTVAFSGAALADLRAGRQAPARTQTPSPSSRPSTRSQTPPPSSRAPAFSQPAARSPSRRPPSSDLPPFAAALTSSEPGFHASHTASSDEPKPVGARNESSVLFTLQGLAADRRPPREEPAPAFDFGPPAPASAALMPLDLSAASSPPPPAPSAPAPAPDPAYNVPALAAPDYTAPSRAPAAARPKRRGPWLLIFLILLVGAGGASYYFRQPPVLYDRYLPLALARLGLASTSAPEPALSDAPTPNKNEPAAAAAESAAPPAALADAAATGVAASAAASPETTAKFDSQIASDKMQETAGVAAKCKQAGQRGGTGRVTVVFGNEGKVLKVEIDGTLQQSPFADCVKQTYGALSVPPFAGPPARMSRGLRIE